MCYDEQLDFEWVKRFKPTDPAKTVAVRPHFRKPPGFNGRRRQSDAPFGRFGKDEFGDGRKVDPSSN